MVDEDVSRVRDVSIKSISEPKGGGSGMVAFPQASEIKEEEEIQTKIRGRKLKSLIQGLM